MLFQISYNQPIKADSHFFRPILLKLAGNVKNGKNRIPLFLFFFKMKNNEDIRDWIFLSFFNSVRLFWQQGWPNFNSV